MHGKVASRQSFGSKHLGRPVLKVFPSRLALPRRLGNLAMSSKGRTAVEETDGGAFKRTDSEFRNWIRPDSEFEPEAGRYHLYISYACPWACRCLTFLYLKGLEGAIGLSITHPTWQKTKPDDSSDMHTGWTFANPDDAPFSSHTGWGSFGCEGCVPDDVNGAKYVRDLYELSKGQTGSKFTVPVLWDKKKGVIVNNESSEIVQILNDQFNSLAKNPGLDLFPDDLRSSIDEVNSWTYPCINNGVYRCGFAQSQKAYEDAFGDLFGALDRVESILSKQRYIAGDRLTEADIRLFQTLIRFDVVYVVYFKCNRNFIHEFPHMSDYTKELYSIPGVQKAVNIDHIKTHYFTSHPTLNHYAIVPLGCSPWWEGSHNRESVHSK
ncbi:hypothetical protein WJX84_003362 [Apatococcus fuscideae]|uniref:GST C-terminal domain-containing protein n=1 Tax=Apatococcus fuscideae TaxID=2026836 RepID=A0AAW1STL5_9CHLO